MRRLCSWYDDVHPSPWRHGIYSRYFLCCSAIFEASPLSHPLLSVVFGGACIYCGYQWRSSTTLRDLLKTFAALYGRWAPRCVQ